MPPPLMARGLAVGEIDAFCVGEPWGSMAVEEGVDPVQAAAKGAAVVRTDLNRLHLRETGVDLSGASSKLEGRLPHPTALASERRQMILAADRFFDGRIFDPDAADR